MLMGEHNASKVKIEEAAKVDTLTREIVEMAHSMKSGRDIQKFLRKIQVVGRNNADASFAAQVSRKAIAAINGRTWETQEANDDTKPSK